jgi:hypothetical protein
MKIGWLDAQQMHHEHPDSFDVPTTEELRALKAGDFIKIADRKQTERFWLRVQSVDVDAIVGTVANDLEDLPLARDEVVTVEPWNIMGIMTAEDQAAAERQMRARSNN